MPPRKRAVRRRSVAVVDSDAQERIAGPVPAEIVADRRDTRAKRLVLLSFLVVGVVMIGWGLNQLLSAQHDRTNLVKGVRQLVVIIKDQNHDLRDLRQVVIQQNKILRRHGLPTIDVPLPTSEGGGARGGGSSPSPRSHPSSAPPSSRPSQHPTPRPSHRPTPRPTPTPTPTKPPPPPVKICLPIVGCVPPDGAARADGIDWWAIWWP